MKQVMSKNKSSNTSNVPAPGQPMDGRVIYSYQIGELEGKLLTLIESLGLSEKQEKAVKDVFRDTYYRIVYGETAYIYGDHLHKVLDAMKSDDRGMTGR